MNIFLTFDYELFFGPETGTVEKCMIEPTKRLLELAGKNVRMVFFVDVGFLVAMERYAVQYPEMGSILNKVRFQVKQLVDRGHDVELHIHPHWEKAQYVDGKWVIDAMGSYRMNDFSADEQNQLFNTYKSYLDELVGYKTSAYRAGGWCIQPFHPMKDLFLSEGIKFDSSVMPGVKYESEHYKFDFSRAPGKCSYRFDTDVLVEEMDGPFTELPISTWKYTPSFFWNLYVRGRMAPSRHKMIGDGQFIPQPGRKKQGLTSGALNHVSCDGYYASVLLKSYKSFIKQGRENMVIIGHPKGMTEYSFAALESFMNEVRKEASFKTFKDLS